MAFTTGDRARPFQGILEFHSVHLNPRRRRRAPVWNVAGKEIFGSRSRGPGVRPGRGVLALQGQRPRRVVCQDLRKNHDYLAKKGIRMAVWGDVLLESVRGKGTRKRKVPDGWTYNAPGAMTPEQVKNLVPKDILIFNWFSEGNAAWAAPREAQLAIGGGDAKDRTGGPGPWRHIKKSRRR